ncbi:ribosome maturation factor RimM [Funiculus sociatus]|uniref:ribosome maturation factor RimM n=1 Tax=Funiculus sociatus TaxID=450527 RepID=UPI0032986FA7
MELISSSPKENFSSDDWLEIGTIVAAQGLKGELRVYPDSDFPERFEEPGVRWLLRPGETELQPVELVTGRYIPGKKIYVVQLMGVDDRNQAEALQGCKLLVRASDRPTLEEDEFHVMDLIGLEVINQPTGENLGVVVNAIAAGNTLLEVKRHEPAVPSVEETEKPSKGEITRTSKIKKIRSKPPQPINLLIPFVKEIVPVVDLQAGRIEITPPQGLLDV